LRLIQSSKTSRAETSLCERHLRLRRLSISAFANRRHVRRSLRP